MSHKKTKYKTISLPRGLTDDIWELIDEFGYWPSLGAFVREAALEKLKRERIAPGKFVPQPIVFYDKEEPEKSDVVSEIDNIVLEAENDPNVSEEEKEVLREFASEVSAHMIELENLSKSGEER